MIFANAAGMMRDEQPIRVNKCCFPLPVKLRLQTWAYTKIISGLIIVVSLLPVIFGCFHRHIFAQPTMFPLLGVLVVFLIVDIGFQIASVVGVHKKNYNTLKAFFYYEVFALAADFVLTPIILITTNNEHLNVDVSQTVVIIIVGCFYILVDICIIVKVKREIMKIHHKYDLTSVQG